MFKDSTLVSVPVISAFNFCNAFALSSLARPVPPVSFALLGRPLSVLAVGASNCFSLQEVLRIADLV